MKDNRESTGDKDSIARQRSRERVGAPWSEIEGAAVGRGCGHILNSVTVLRPSAFPKKGASDGHAYRVRSAGRPVPDLLSVIWQ